MMQPIENWKCDNTHMKYETVKSLKDADFKRSTGVSRRVFDQMLQVVEKGLRSFGRPPKLSHADQLPLSSFRNGLTFFSSAKYFFTPAFYTLASQRHKPRA